MDISGPWRLWSSGHVLAFNSDDPCSNPAEVSSFSGKMLFEENENKQKRGRGWQIKKLVKGFNMSLMGMRVYQKIVDVPKQRFDVLTRTLDSCDYSRLFCGRL